MPNHIPMGAFSPFPKTCFWCLCNYKFFMPSRMPAGVLFFIASNSFLFTFCVFCLYCCLPFFFYKNSSFVYVNHHDDSSWWFIMMNHHDDSSWRIILVPFEQHLGSLWVSGGLWLALREPKWGSKRGGQQEGAENIPHAWWPQWGRRIFPQTCLCHDGVLTLIHPKWE